MVDQCGQKLIIMNILRQVARARPNKFVEL